MFALVGWVLALIVFGPWVYAMRDYQLYSVFLFFSLSLGLLYHSLDEL